MSLPPCVSVIIPCHNAGRTVSATLTTLLAQDFPDWEALIIDDASTDDSRAIAARFATSDPRFRLLATAGPGPLGAAQARNAGMDAAKGRYIAFLDADDLWRPHKLSCQIKALTAGAAIVFSAYRRFDDQTGTTLGIVHAKARVAYADALHGNPIGCLTAIWDSHRLGPAHMPEMALQHDYAFWLSLLRRGVIAQGLPDVLADYRVSARSLSSSKFQAAKATWQVLRAEPDLPLPRAATGFAFYAARAVFRRVIPAAITRTLSDR